MNLTFSDIIANRNAIYKAGMVIGAACFGAWCVENFSTVVSMLKRIAPYANKVITDAVDNAMTKNRVSANAADAAN